MVPDDAGEWAEGLQKILDRIPPNWGKHIRVSAGWYPIIVALDQAIAVLQPDYQIHQVKEKFGGLRYYCQADGDPAIRASDRCCRS